MSVSDLLIVGGGPAGLAAAIKGASEGLQVTIIDHNGYIVTDENILPFDASLPGVFAAGDCRLGSVKNVGVAVGEGISSVFSVHKYLASLKA